MLSCCPSLSRGETVNLQSIICSVFNCTFPPPTCSFILNLVIIFITASLPGGLLLRGEHDQRTFLGLVLFRFRTCLFKLLLLSANKTQRNTCPVIHLVYNLRCINKGKINMKSFSYYVFLLRKLNILSL